MDNVVSIYCRLSDEDRDKPTKESDSESIQNQKNMLTKYAIEQGWSIYKIYSDDDYSGQDADRPEFNQLLRDAEAGKFSIILCKSQARFTRDMELVEKYLHNRFLLWGIRFIGLADNADTANKFNKKQRQILGLTNEWYSEDISANVKSVFDYKRNDGQFIGSFAPYGYVKDPENKNKLIIDEKAAEVVRLIFNLYLEGYGAQNITFQLNEKGIPNPTMHKQNQGLNFVNSSMKDNFGLWNKTTVRRILKNQVYIGNLVQAIRKKVSYKSKKIISNPKGDWIIVEDTHSPIVDKKTFDDVQKRMSANRRSSGKGKAHIFATKVRCATCGSNMNKVTTSHKNYHYSYLRCKLYSVTPGKKMCSSHSVRLDDLEKIVASKMRERFNLYLDSNSVGKRLKLEAEKNDSVNRLRDDLRKVEKQIALNSDVLKNLYTDKVKGLISEKEFVELKKNFEVEKEDVEKQRERIAGLIVELENQKLDIDKFVNMVETYKNFKELTPAIVNNFIDFIEIGEKDKKTGDQEVIIHWLSW
ncbi:MAG TPA: recombinase family protein [Petrimonas sp.]|nr:recombinase family protein [Petrimonas sp.]